MTQKVVRFWLATLVLFTAFLLSAPSQAQEFYSKGAINVALERAFGIHYRHENVDPPGPGDDSNDATAIGIGWYGALTPFHYTRAALDVFVIQQLSVGGSVGFWSHSGDADDDGFLLAPRVGYAIPLSQTFTFWPRGGFTFYDNDAHSVLALSGEAAFVAQFRPNWALIGAFTLDFGFTGEAGEDTDFTEIAFGFPAIGLLVSF